MPPTDPESVELHYLDGTVWAAWSDPPVSSERRWTVARLDGKEWRLLDQPLIGPLDDDWVELFTTDDGDLWAWTGAVLSRWDDGEWIRDGSGAAHPADDRVGPDGGRWQTYDPDWDCEWDWESEPCPSVVRFDGVRGELFLADACADSIDIGPDGSVWALARTGPAKDPTWDLYVITPAAVAASG